MKIESENCILIPLTSNQLEMWINDITALENEIGYGLAKNHEHCGYMTESVKSICEFALSQPRVKCVIAETEMYNQSSQRVLL